MKNEEYRMKYESLTPIPSPKGEGSKMKNESNPSHKQSKIYSSFFILHSSFFILSFFCSLSVKAQGNILEPELPTQYVEIKEEKPKSPFFQGFTLSADVVGVAQYFLSDYGSVEAALRLNLKNTFFPIVEMGLADCDITDENTSI